MCRNIIRPLLAPEAFAASTKSRSLRLKNSARTSRETSIQLVKPIIIIIMYMLGPTMAMTASIRKKVGKVSMTSTNRMSTASTLPPKKPAREPITIPMQTEIPTATNPTESDMRLP